MLDYLRTLDWMPRTLRKRMKAIEKKRIEKISLDPQKDANEIVSEIAAELEMDVSDVETIEREIKREQVLSLDKYLLDDGMEENFASENETPDKVFDRHELSAKLERAIKSLNDKEQLVLSLYYEQELTFREISNILEISESRTCQIHSTALAKVKEMIKEVV